MSWIQADSIFFVCMTIAAKSVLVGSLTNEMMWHSDCSHEYESINSPNGHIHSSNYPDEYENNLFCVYDFLGRQNERVILTIESLDLEPTQTISVLQVNNGQRVDEVDHVEKTLFNDEYSEKADVQQCFYDYLDVYSIDVLGFYRMRSRYCGKHENLQIVSTSPKLRLIFATDRNLAYSGFKIRYHFSYLNILPFITHALCGNSQIEGVGGKLKSPNYPSKFPDNIECAWTITVEQTKNILIKFVEIDFVEACHLSYVRIWDGYVNKPDKPDFSACQKLEFYLKNQKYFLSKTNRMVIKFNGNKPANLHAESISNDSAPSKKTGSKHGFLFTWTAVYQDDENCPGFRCKGGELCIDTKNSICQKTNNAYCINSSLVCDGYSHCDIGDDSDETNCGSLYLNAYMLSKYSLLVYVCLFIFILIALVLSVSLCNKSKSKRNRNQLKQDVNPPDNDLRYYCARQRDKVRKYQTLDPYISPSVPDNQTNIVWQSDSNQCKQLLEHTDSKQVLTSVTISDQSSSTNNSAISDTASLVRLDQLKRRNSYTIALNL